MSNILEKICTDKRVHVAKQKVKRPINELLSLTTHMPQPRPFRKALVKKKELSQPGLIAEIKKASPSKGILREDFQPGLIGRSYKEGGAACLSILTDEPYFKGHDTYLNLVKEHVSLPVLRKDFMLDPYQIIESRILGADCILLIMAALDDSQAKDLFQTAKEHNMDVLVEVHDYNELERASKFGPDLVGINSRNLKTLEVDLNVTYDLLSKMPDFVIKVAESGIKTHKDIKKLSEAGADAFLIGESLIIQEDIEAATKNILGIK